MRATSYISICTILFSLTSFGQLKDRRDKISYSIGVNIGKSFKQQDMDLNLDVLFQGLKDARTGNKLLMGDQEMNDTLVAIRKETQERMAAKSAKEATENKKVGEDFLAANKKKDSVVTLPDGLQYKILREGTGKMPTLEDTVTVHYRGYLMDGTDFDNSYKRGEPATFPLSGVIKGWQEVLQLMKTGSKWQVFIPSDLGYGERGMGGVIGPNAVLIFDVELISFK